MGPTRFELATSCSPFFSLRSKKRDRKNKRQALYQAELQAPISDSIVFEKLIFIFARFYAMTSEYPKGPKPPETVVGEFASIVRDAVYATGVSEFNAASSRLKGLVDYVGRHVGFYKTDPVNAGCVAGAMHLAIVKVESQRSRFRGRYQIQ